MGFLGCGGHCGQPVRLGISVCSLKQAFQDEFGVAAEAFAENFAAFLRATQGDAKRRLRGTMWQSVSLNAAAMSTSASSEDDVGGALDITSELLK